VVALRDRFLVGPGTTGSSDIVRILTKPTIRVTTTRPLLEQLTQTLHCVASAELGELVEERDAVMRQRS
jgi:hypothetical protein